VVVEAESVSWGQRNGAIRLTQEEQVSVFDDERFSDVAVDGMNLWDEIRVFFASNGVARSSEYVPVFSHDSGEDKCLVANASSANFAPKIGDR
jgi:hypothetical protein